MNDLFPTPPFQMRSEPHYDFILSATQLQCVRGNRRLFSGVSFAINAGGLLHVEGCNGCGKTSLMRLLCGLSRPEQGEIRWRGRPISALGDEYRADVLYLGHSNGVKDELSALENLLAMARIGSEPLEEGGARDALAALGLQGSEDLPAKALSQGQKRRVALARLTTTRKPLWLLDEPVAALDRSAAIWFESMLATHLARSGVVVLTTHQEICTPSGSSQRLRLAD
jgi:heme exporter protein A